VLFVRPLQSGVCKSRLYFTLYFMLFHRPSLYILAATHNMAVCTFNAEPPLDECRIVEYVGSSAEYGMILLGARKISKT
jgi:hypothetical protein